MSKFQVWVAYPPQEKNASFCSILDPVFWEIVYKSPIKFKVQLRIETVLIKKVHEEEAQDVGDAEDEDAVGDAPKRSEGLADSAELDIAEPAQLSVSYF